MKLKMLFVAAVLILASVACQFGQTATKTSPKEVINTTVNPQNPSEANATKISPSSYIDQVVMALDTQGDMKDPVNPVASFPDTAVVHAVVQIKDAPADTKVTAKWFVVDVGGAAEPGQSIDETDLTTEGTRNLDFTLKPQDKWPTGSYKVEVYVNDKLDTTVVYTVK